MSQLRLAFEFEMARQIAVQLGAGRTIVKCCLPNGADQFAYDIRSPGLTNYLVRARQRFGTFTSPTGLVRPSQNRIGADPPLSQTASSHG
jgi:hypothetical protein